jgi:hypothetical protein
MNKFQFIILFQKGITQQQQQEEIKMTKERIFKSLFSYE